MPHTNEHLLNKPKDEELEEIQPSPILGVTQPPSPGIGLGLNADLGQAASQLTQPGSGIQTIQQQPNVVGKEIDVLSQQPNVVGKEPGGPNVLTQQPIIVDKEPQKEIKTVKQQPIIVDREKTLPGVIVPPEKQLEMNEKEAGIPVDPTGKNSEQIQNEIFQKTKTRLLKDTMAIDQARRDRLKQDISQAGAFGQGVGNSLLSMLNASQSAQLTNGLENLAIQQLQLESAEFKESKAGLINMLNGLAGDPDAQLELGKQIAVMFPNDAFFQFLSTDPNAKEYLKKIGSQAFFEKKQQALQNANTIISQIPDLTNAAVVNNSFDNWKETFFFDDEDWLMSATSWLSRGDIDREELEGIHQELFGELLPNGDISAETAKELYAKWSFDQQVKNLKTQDIKLGIIDALVDPTDEELEIAQGMGSVLSSFEGEITIDQMTGMFNQNAIQGEGAFGIYFEDWDGISYDLDQNSRSGRDLFNQNLDELWLSAVNKVGFENLPTREEFKEAFKDNALEFEVDKRVMSKGEAAGIFSNSEFFKNRTKVVTPGEEVVTTDTIGFPDIPNVSRETINSILSSDSDTVNRTLTGLNDIDLGNIFQNDLDGQIARQMIEKGAVPNSVDIGLELFGAELFLNGTQDGRVRGDINSGVPSGFTDTDIRAGSVPKFMSDGKKIYKVRMVGSPDPNPSIGKRKPRIKFEFIDLSTGAVVSEIFSTTGFESLGRTREVANKFNTTNRFETQDQQIQDTSSSIGAGIAGIAGGIGASRPQPIGV